MFVRSKTRTLILVFLLFYSIQTISQNYQCASDINGDGDLDDIGEVESCLSDNNQNPFCPIGAVDCISDSKEICPIDSSLPCINNECNVNKSGNCELVLNSVFITAYQCSTTEEYYSNITNEDPLSQCISACNITETHSCTMEEPTFTCPIGSQINCLANSSSIIPQCTINECQDISINGIVETIESVDSSLYINDGERDAEGICLGETRIFSGRAMSCRLPGVVSAYKNCCTDNNGKIYHDSKGNVIENTLTNKAIISTAAAAYAAGAAFSTAINAGASTASAAQSGGQAFVNSLQGAFDPTSLAIAVAIALIQEWLANACDQESMETAALRSSGYCFQVGRVCTNRWLGSCVQREEVSCCYNSMLARIVNEQGLEQILGERPYSNIELDADNLSALDCGGFTPEQFQALDFQRIDFSEYDADINEAVTERINTEGDAAVERFMDNDIQL